MNKIIAGCIVALCFFSACADKEPDHDSSLMNATPATGSTQTVATTENAKVDSTQPQVVSMPATQTPNVATTATAPGMNPPHGQPGHRCDIEVGAPLNSPATKPTTQTVTATPTATAAPSATITPVKATKTAPGMNPPHGEPGHRCDIAVGAPLNSPVVTKPAVQKVEPVVMQPKKDSAM